MSVLLIENQYIGTVNYYKMLFQYKHVKIEQFEYYPKASFRNRCIIPGANGLIQLSVPLKNGRNQKAVMKDVEIAYKENWVLQHTRTFDACYNRAPFYEYYRDEFIALLEKRESSLLQLNLSLMKWVLHKLKANIDIELTTSYEAATTEAVTDYRNRILPNNYFNDLNPIIYKQVFEDRTGFIPNLSIIDLLFCLGPMANELLTDSINRF